MDFFLYFIVLLKAVLFSTGGFGPLPSLHTDFIANSWAIEKQFTEALSIGQITPGPNGLWVVSLSYLTGGITGSVLACFALTIPPLFVLLVQQCYKRIAHLAVTKGFLDGLVLVLTSFTVLVLANIFQNGTINTLTVIIMIISAILAISRRVPVNLILLIAALIGAIKG